MMRIEWRSEAACCTRHHAGKAFTLLEVMIALAIFFMAVFAILDCTSQSLGAARRLQLNEPDVGMLVADLMLTNKLEEGMEEGDFGDAYPGFTWTREIFEVATNGFFEVDLTVVGNVANRPYASATALYLWRPDSRRLLNPITPR
jgi:hypothetical protein